MAPPNNNFNDENDLKPMDNANEKLMDWEAPKAQGLYDPQNEHDACGVGFIVAIDGRRNHKVSVSIVLSKLSYSTQITKPSMMIKLLGLTPNKITSCRSISCFINNLFWRIFSEEGRRRRNSIAQTVD